MLKSSKFDNILHIHPFEWMISLLYKKKIT